MKEIEQRADPFVFSVVGEIFKEMQTQFVSWGTLEKIIASAINQTRLEALEEVVIPEKTSNAEEIVDPFKQGIVYGRNQVIREISDQIRTLAKKE